MKNIISFLILIIFASTTTAQTTINGVTLPNKLGFNETVRHYVGGGYREQFFVRAYTLGLYMNEKSMDPKTIISADKPMSVRLQMTSALLTSELMAKKIREGFDKSCKGNIEPYKEMIDLICNVFSYEKTKVGDVYDIHYSPEIGISCSKNAKGYDFAALSKKQQGTVEESKNLNSLMASLNYTKSGQSALPGLPFKQVLFGIWFSDNPVDEDLKFDVLGIE